MVDLLSLWNRYFRLLLANHSTMYACGLLLGWLYRLSKNDPCVRTELNERIKKEQEIFDKNQLIR